MEAPQSSPALDCAPHASMVVHFLSLGGSIFSHFFQGGSYAWATYTQAFSAVGAPPAFSCVLVLAADLPHPQDTPTGNLLSQEKHSSRARTLLVAPFGFPEHPSPKRASHPPA